jgi:catechol 2,3-dioxygenase-like lactoylglutathione lyase family enzyme
MQPRERLSHGEDAQMSLVVRNITFSCADPKRLADFWSAVTGYTQRRDSQEEVLLAPDDWSFPRFSFQHAAAPRSGPGRLHLDLTAADMVVEVDRLSGLGATTLWSVDMAQSGTTTWTVMRDPDGNEFCVVQRPQDG